VKKDKDIGKRFVAIAARWVIVKIGWLLLVIGMGFLVMILILAHHFKGCQSEPASEFVSIEIAKTVALPKGNCSRSGHIVKKESIGDELEWLLIRDDQDEAGIYWGAIASKQENLKPKDLVEICYVDVIHSAPTNHRHKMLGYARKTLHSYYEPSELEKFEQCQNDLAECNDHVSTLVKAIDKNKASPSNLHDK